MKTIKLFGKMYEIVDDNGEECKGCSFRFGSKKCLSLSLNVNCDDIVFKKIPTEIAVDLIDETDYTECDEENYRL